jgi:hypothetical protein
MKRGLFILLCFCFLQGHTQKPKKTAPFSVRGAIGIPRSVSSTMFRTAFNGVYEFNVSANARIFSNFSAGVGFQNTHFQNNKQVFAYKQWIDKNGNSTGAALSYNTRLNANALYVRLGYDKFLEKAFISYVLHAGVMQCEYKNLNGDTTQNNKPLVSALFTTPYLQPEIAVNFLTDGRLTFSILLSYGTMLKRFDPKAPRFNNIAEVSSKNNKYLVSWINIGFGFAILLGDL